MSRASDLLLAFEDLTWENYVALSDKIVQVNRHDIEGELMRHASTYSYYSGLLSFAKKRLSQAQLRLDQFMAQTRKGEHETRLSKGLKATDKYLEAYVISHPEYGDINIAADDARFKLGLLKSLVEALEQKKDMLVQLSANSRAETSIYK